MGDATFVFTVAACGHATATSPAATAGRFVCLGRVATLGLQLRLKFDFVLGRLVTGSHAHIVNQRRITVGCEQRCCCCCCCGSSCRRVCLWLASVTAIVIAIAPIVIFVCRIGSGGSRSCCSVPDVPFFTFDSRHAVADRTGGRRCALVDGRRQF